MDSVLKCESCETCRHYRYQLPQEEADELRAADSEPCALCDPLMRRRGIVFEEIDGHQKPILPFCIV